MDVALPFPARVPRDSHRLVLACGSAAALAAVAVSMAVAVQGASEQPWLVAVARGFITGAPMAVGLYAWHRRAHARFGVLLMAGSAGWFVTTLAESGDELVYSAGRAAGWIAEVLFVYLVLAFPSGRLPGRPERVLVASLSLAVLVLFAPRLVLAQDFDVPSPFTSCMQDCPPNAFFALDAEPGLVDTVLRPFGALAVLAVSIGTVVLLYRRRAGATIQTRRVLTPVLSVAALFVALLGIGITARAVDPSSASLEVVAWLLALSMPAVSLAFLAGLLGWRLFAGRALERLALCLWHMPDRPALRRAFAEAFDDASLELAFPSGDPAAPWTDCAGRPTTLPYGDAERGVSEIRHEGRLVAAIAHDRALLSDPELLAAGTAMAAVALDNQRLGAESQAAVRELHLSRARIAATAEQERRRIERDLHDGAQQRLVALRIELGLAEDLVHRDPDEAAAWLHRLEDEVDQALEDLRALAHGVYPPLLADRGLAEALRAAAIRIRIPVQLETRHVRRYSPEIESAVYFCVLEALQNVLKHAADARRVVIRLDGGAEQLRFSVRDDGAGAPGGTIRPGAGVTNMHDRLAAVGGDVQVVSTPNVGTLVRGHAPTADVRA
jgi:signal transduction histidine kinase